MGQKHLKKYHDLICICIRSNRLCFCDANLYEFENDQMSRLLGDDFLSKINKKKEVNDGCN